MTHKPGLGTLIKRFINYYRLRIKFYGEKLIGHEFVPLRNYITIEFSGYCNLTCKFCAYGKKKIGHDIMTNDAFADYVDQATELGYRNFSVTSSSGEIFFDKEAVWKLDYLENHSLVDSYGFYTNFVLPDEPLIDKICSLKKLAKLAFSIYGHDLESFKRITGKTEKQYDKLVENLNRMADRPAPGRLREINVRTDRTFTWHPKDGIDDNSSELIKAMHRAATEGGLKWLGNFLIYDSWGGMITQEDIAEIDIELSDGSLLPKVGACIYLFDEPMIFADGSVNACACRGVERSLQIGDLKETSLKQILSSNNTGHRDLIERHQKNDYPETCKDCTIYQSVYRKPRGWAYTSIPAFFKKHQERAKKESLI